MITVLYTYDYVMTQIQPKKYKIAIIFWGCVHHRAEFEGDCVVNCNVIKVFKQLLLSLLVRICVVAFFQKRGDLQLFYQKIHNSIKSFQKYGYPDDALNVLSSAHKKSHLKEAVANPEFGAWKA